MAQRTGMECFSKGQELYLAADYGRVEGQSTQYLVGHQLAGTALGLRGSLFSRLSYDLFVGVPLYKPKNSIRQERRQVLASTLKFNRH